MNESANKKQTPKIRQFISLVVVEFLVVVVEFLVVIVEVVVVAVAEVVALPSVALKG